MKISNLKFPQPPQNTEFSNTTIRSRLALVISGASQEHISPPFPMCSNSGGGVFSESPIRGEKGKFSDLLKDNNEGHRKDLYNDVDNYLTVPVELFKLSTRERETASSYRELTIHWTQNSPKFEPTECEKVQGSDKVALQFSLDLPRGNYTLQLPDNGGKEIELDKSVSSEEKIKTTLTDAFGPEHLKKISEIATQAHMAAPTAMIMAITKNDYLATPNSVDPSYIIKKQEDLNYVITTSKTFEIMNIYTEKFIEGLTVEMTRTSILRPDPDDKTQLLSGAEEEKDGMNFKICYLKSDPPAQAKSEQNIWKILTNVRLW